MIVYQLHVFTPEGEDPADEYFTSARAAKRRRMELILAGNAHEFGDFEIEKLVLAKMPPRALVLAILNGRGFVASREVVLPEYVPSEHEENE